MSDLPVNLDTTYNDDGTDASVKAHQQHHDALHTRYNAWLGNPKVDGGSVGLIAPGWALGPTWGTYSVVHQMYEWLPWYLAEAKILTEIGFNVSTQGAAGSTARLAIYDADTDWQPTDRVLDGGTLDTTTTGWKSVASLALAMPAGRYLVGLQSAGGSGTDFAVRSGQGGFVVASAGSGTGLGATYMRWRRNAVNAAYPDPATAGIMWQTEGQESAAWGFGRFT